MLLQLTDVSSEPLHSQISRQLRALILAGDLNSGTALPSIRGLARQEKVSVITVQRAYEDLEREGLILARRGKGFFVAGLSDTRKDAMAQDRFRDALSQVLQEALAEGLDPGTLKEIFEGLLSPNGGAA